MRLHTYGRKLGDTAAPASHATLHGTWDKAGYPKHIPAKLFKTAVLQNIYTFDDIRHKMSMRGGRPR